MISPAERDRQNWSKLADAGSRTEKAAKILAVLGAFATTEPGQRTCLDLGCGSGIIAASLAPHFARLVACDLEPGSIAFARSRFPGPNLFHLLADATTIPLADASCDVVICAHVYEHVSNAEALAGEIARVLKPGGVCFFAGPNLLSWYEPHLKTWFLHWFPRPIANLVLRTLGRPAYAERLRTRWGMSRLLRGFEILDVTVALVRDPVRFHTTGEPGIRLARHLPPVVLRPLLTLFAPSFNLILRNEKRTATL